MTHHIGDLHTWPDTRPAAREARAMNYLTHKANQARLQRLQWLERRALPAALVVLVLIVLGVGVAMADLYAAKALGNVIKDTSRHAALYQEGF